MRRRTNPAISLDSSAHLIKAGGAVLLSKRLPGKTHWSNGEVLEIATADNEVFRAVEFE
jgi:hypothetical protein